ncbi:MAG: DeoR/GlpR family DNA-binding transcription regulator [Rikenellaceae bacterium]|nr:DeoR/GlpR family DNA-binding transcription regulator [Rikenellaceae bacterium]
MKNGDASSGLSLVERQEKIMEILRESGSVPVSVLSDRLKVSDVTIRKDLNSLEKKQMLYRPHGSAVLMNPYINDRHINVKEKQNAEQKRLIGAYAARLVEPSDTILIASGTTVMAFAREISGEHQLTAITSALSVAMILSKHRNIDVIQLGGPLRNSSVSAVGPFAEQMLGNFTCSKLFLGVDGIDPEYGLTTTNLLEASLNRVMIESVEKVIVLADSGKFGRKGSSKICETGLVNRIITDSGIPDRTHNAFMDAGVEVSIV